MEQLDQTLGWQAANGGGRVIERRLERGCREELDDLHHFSKEARLTELVHQEELNHYG